MVEEKWMGAHYDTTWVASESHSIAFNAHVSTSVLIPTSVFCFFHQATGAGFNQCGNSQAVKFPWESEMLWWVLASPRQEGFQNEDGSNLATKMLAIPGNQRTGHKGKPLLTTSVPLCSERTMS